MKFQLLLLILGATFAVAQKDNKAHIADEAVCTEANTQAEMNTCLANAYKSADEELNRIYFDIKKKQTPAIDASLKTAQRAWIQYRDANCNAAAALYEGGTIQPSARYECLRRTTRARIDELQRIYSSNPQ
jgi:uncharacterized protein YecT (DUF1311 family)